VPEWSLAYRAAFPGAPIRPNLTLHLTGPNGRSGEVTGVVDSGADQTSLPLGYASLMGYTGANLATDTAATAGGSTAVFVAQEPVHAYVVGLPAITFELFPMFAKGSSMVLWGREDFFTVFRVFFDEATQRFSLIRD
jgi:hypothetical protein